MTCQEFWNSLPQAATPQEHQDHMRECPACAAACERQGSLRSGLRTVADQWRHLQAPARVEDHLVAAFRAHSGLATRPLRRQWLPVATWLAAAAGIALVAITLVSGRPGRPPAPHRTGKNVEWAIAQSSGDPVSAEDLPYSDGDFIPLPNAAQIGPNEDVNLVRVEVPRSTMIELGYEVSPDRISEPVEAEVVLGADGLARAVRFLDE